MAKTKKRKRWPSHKYWTEHYGHNNKRFITILRNGYTTISKTFSAELLNRDGENHTDEEVDNFAKHLEAGRDEALNVLREAGIEVYVVGESRIELMSTDPKYEEEHLRRIARMLDQKKLASFKKTPGATKKQRKDFGLPGPEEIATSSQRLLLGDSDFEVHLKRIN